MNDPERADGARPPVSRRRDTIEMYLGARAASADEAERRRRAGGFVALTLAALGLAERFTEWATGYAVVAVLVAALLFVLLAARAVREHRELSR